MYFKVEPTSPLPMYRQLIDQIRFAIASGRLKDQQQLPSVRILSESLQVNIQTVTKAYGELVREGILQNRKGLGTFVAESAASGSQQAPAVLNNRITKLCDDAQVLGLSKEELLALVKKQWKARRL